ncbi:hypothetical protein GLV94_05140 [Virgibacillus halodenitrificans]|uniref:hypothetical protein n=1 Tax=Virgibacillus halodenitrificans TaxID=1482 RepID=UPI0013717B0F|nr:hypothetical protein [Virgibacillus halodenitrificans]MYL45019.1 hypothetical protein [Virgibacillus halodenitrificans]
MNHYAEQYKLMRNGKHDDIQDMNRSFVSIAQAIAITGNISDLRALSKVHFNDVSNFFETEELSNETNQAI